MEDFSAGDVLSVEVKEEGRAGVDFLNWQISPRPFSERPGTADSFHGPGLYALWLDDELIYIGSYRGVASSEKLHSGDVVASRWWTHIASITARGNKVHIANHSIEALASEFGESHSLVSGLRSAANPEELHTDAGCLSPLKRLRFAISRWDVFFESGIAPDTLLKRFNFSYARVETLPASLDITELQRKIVAKERDLIQSFKPVCNTTHVPNDAQAALASVSEVRESLQKAVADI